MQTGNRKQGKSTLQVCHDYYEVMHKSHILIYVLNMLIFVLSFWSLQDCKGGNAENSLVS